MQEDTWLPGHGGSDVRHERAEVRIHTEVGEPSAALHVEDALHVIHVRRKDATARHEVLEVLAPRLDRRVVRRSGGLHRIIRCYLHLLSVERLAQLLRLIRCMLESAAHSCAHWCIGARLPDSHEDRGQLVRAQDGGDVAGCLVRLAFSGRRLGNSLLLVPHRSRRPSRRKDALRQDCEVGEHDTARARSAPRPPQGVQPVRTREPCRERAQVSFRALNSKMVFTHLPFPTRTSLFRSH